MKARLLAVAKERKLPREQVETLLAEQTRQFDEIDRAPIEQRKQQIREQARAARETARAKAPITGVTGNIGSAIANRVNTAAFGLPQTAAAALAAPYMAHKLGSGLGEGFQFGREMIGDVLESSPVGATVGKLAAFTGPGGRVSRALGPSAARAATDAAFIAAGGQKLAQAAARMDHFGKRAATQIAAAYAGGTAASSLIQGVEGLQDERSLTEVGTDILQTAMSPLNVGLSVGLGTAAAGVRAKMDPETRRLLALARQRLPGFRPTPDMERPGSFWSGLVDYLRISPTGRTTAGKVAQEAVWDPMRAAVRRLKATSGASGNVARDIETAAGSVKRLLPGEGMRGEIKERIKQLGEAGVAGSEAAGETVSGSSWQIMGRAIEQIRARADRKRGAEGAHSAAFSAILDDLWSVARGPRRQTPIHQRTAGQQAYGKQFPSQPFVAGITQGDPKAPLVALEEIRQRLGALANFDERFKVPGGPTSRDVRDARILYGVTRAVIGRNSPQHLGQALEDIKQLRSFEKAFAPMAQVANVGDDVQIVEAMATRPDFRHRWPEYLKKTTLPEQQAMRGAYAARMMEEVFLGMDLGKPLAGQRILSRKNRLNELLRHGSSPYRREVVDRILGPAFRQELEDIAEVSTMVAKSPLIRAEGSETAGRLLFDQTVVSAARELPSATSDIIRGIGGAKMGLITQKVLGLTGLVWLARNVTQGRLSQILAKGMTQDPFLAGSAAIPAAMTAGGVGASRDLLRGGVETAIGGMNTAIPAIQAGVGLAQRGERR